jgi:citrate lyase beta subunit
LFLSQAELPLHHITIPKTGSISEFNRVKASLTGMLPKKKSTLPPLRILVEHPTILPDLGAIACDSCVETLELGIMDFISSMNGAIPMDECTGLHEFNNPLLQHLKSLISLEAARSNKTAVHNVCREYQDIEHIERFCVHVKKIRFWENVEHPPFTDPGNYKNIDPDRSRTGRSNHDSAISQKK